MKVFVTLLILNPLLNFLFLSLAGRIREAWVSRLTSFSIFFQWVLTLLISVRWLYLNSVPIENLLMTVYDHGDFKFTLYYLIDTISIAGLLTVTTIFLLVTRFSRYYLHKDPGYQRYFAILQLFLLGLTILMIAGNIDFLFAGWEFLGVSSFLLIGFYHHRLSAIKNSLFVYGLYRFTDIGLILGAWLKKSYYAEAHRFAILEKISASGLIDAFNPTTTWLLGFLILLSAVGKSAQFPISFWLAKAMEGPTSSSAIFYGALSLHAGVFLLLRTFPFWFSNEELRLLVFGIGTFTMVFSGLSAQSQANIKGRLAYVACFHVGMQFIELSLGFPSIALIHIAGHMFVRCYQFLVSPAIVTYALRVQNIANHQKPNSRDRFFFSLPERLRNSIYNFSFNEGYCEQLIDKWILSPFRSFTLRINRLRLVLVVGGFVLTLICLWGALYQQIPIFSIKLEWVLTAFMMLVALAAYGESCSSFWLWNSIGLSNCMFGLLVLFATNGNFEGGFWFLGSVFTFSLSGNLALFGLSKNLTSPSLKTYSALSSIHPWLSHLLLISFLGLAGFPLSPSFLGEDMVLHHLTGPQAPFALIGAFVLMINGISAARLYTRVCWGPTDTV